MPVWLSSEKEAALYWDIDDCLYFLNNVEFNAGTDERARTPIRIALESKLQNGDGVLMMLILF